MDLKQAAAYFAQTPYDTWNGTAWTTNAGTCAVKPTGIQALSDFGNHSRYVVTAIASPIATAVIRVAGQVYICGDPTYPTKYADPTANVYYAQLAPFTATLKKVTTAQKASGVPGSKTLTTQGTVYCDLQFSDSDDSVQLGRALHAVYTVLVPRTVTISSEYVIEVAGRRLDVELTYPKLGFTYCRCPEAAKL